MTSYNIKKQKKKSLYIPISEQYNNTTVYPIKDKLNKKNDKCLQNLPSDNLCKISDDKILNNKKSASTNLEFYDDYYEDYYEDLKNDNYNYEDCVECLNGHNNLNNVCKNCGENP